MLFALLSVAAAYTPTKHGIRFPVGKASVELAVEGTTHFRVSVDCSGANASQIETPMIENHTQFSSFTVVTPKDGVVGLATGFGTALVDTKTGGFQLLNAREEHKLVDTPALFSCGSDVSLNFKSDADSAEYYGTGYSGSDGDKITSTGRQAEVSNTLFYTPQYWSTVGYQVMVASAAQFDPSAHNLYTVKWTSQGSSTSFTVLGDRADVYITPAEGMALGLQALWQLTGPPVVPPRYFFGFIACRWGWKDRAYIENVLETFRNESYPIDAWISDFEWYTDLPDYKVPDQGEANYTDFGFNPVTFPDPLVQLKDYHERLHLRFGGIRKPRLGNTALLNNARSKGWLISVGGGGAAGGNRNLNYSLPAVREWYKQQMDHYRGDGVDFFWNDEGESTFFTTHWWVQSEFDLLAEQTQGKGRYISINRDFTPGMQRIGGGVWTGDQSISWDALSHHPEYLTSWTLSGAGLITSDTGGFSNGDENAELLTRWYQLSCFTSVMRIHSTLDKPPHFPWLWGDEAAAAMRKAMNLRYSLVPFLYSLTHKQHADLVPVYAPLAYYFAHDSTAVSTTSQWMVGNSLMPAPVLQQGGKRSVYFPKGSNWYRFNSTDELHAGGTTVDVQAALDEVPVYVREGAVIPMAKPVQYTDQFPNGPLDVYVYAGADGSFTLQEDDGESTDYQSGKIRKTTFWWSDASKQLTWEASGITLSSAFQQVRLVWWSKGASKTSEVVAIANGGKIKL
eukprot:Hpha_TRINITY_DN9270_c0_g1::TRINITY_DN9270_c0_g1_i1::g.28851::m.28851/K01187/malZ; alpha-glucosidase